MQVARARLLACHRLVLGEESGDLLSSMVIGDQAAKPSDALVAAFRDVGLSHVLAASGFNVSVVVLSVVWLARRLVRRRQIVTILAMSGLLLFVGLSGLSPSVERAAIMACVVLVATCSSRSVYTPVCLGVALVLTLALSPLAITEIGLQLSYAATAGIIFGANRLGGCAHDSNAFVKGAWQAVIIVLVAQLSVLPLQLEYFGRFGLFFLLTNLLVTPFLSVVTLLGFASSALAVVGQLAPVTVLLDDLAALPLSAIVAIVHFFAGLKWAMLSLGQPLPIAIWLYYVFLAAAVYAASRWRWRLSLLSLLLALAAVCIRPPLPPLMVIAGSGGMLFVDDRRQAYFAGRGEPVWCKRALITLCAERCEQEDLAGLGGALHSSSSPGTLTIPRHGTQLYIWQPELQKFAEQSHYP